jgi:pyridoxine kinase
VPLSGTGDLFSALYLGHYLSTKDPVLALQKAKHQMQKVIENTFHGNQRELQILSVDYKENIFELPQLHVL